MICSISGDIQHSSVSQEEPNVNFAPSRFQELLDSYSSSFTVHGLSKIWHGTLIERLFWGVCIVAISSFIMYMGSIYVTRYLAKGVRSDITYEEHQEIDMPALSFCLKSTFFNTFFCYNNTSIHPGITCNTAKKHSAMRFYDGSDWKELEDVGNNCHVFGINKTYPIAPEKQFIRFQFYTPNIRFEEIVIKAVHQSQMRASSDFVFITQFNTYIKLSTRVDWKIRFEKTKISRLPAPYPSNCTNDGNLFSSINTSPSQQEECAMLYMHRECGVVVDRWRRYVSGKILPLNTSKYATREECLSRVIDFVELKALPNCNTRPRCKEERYDPKLEVLLRASPNIMNVEVFFDKPITMNINETPDYQFADFIGGLGGFIGVCIGMSLFSILELIVYTFLYIVKRVKRACRLSA